MSHTLHTGSVVNLRRAPGTLPAQSPRTAHTAVSARPPIAILGVPFDNVTTVSALDLIGKMIASRRPHYLVTANVDFVSQARNDLELRRILFDAHLVVADGMPVVWASRWLGNPLPERVTGAGLVPLLLAEASAKGWRVFFLGSTEQSLEHAAANVRARHPNLQLVGAYSPPFKPLIDMDHEDILRRIRTARPDILLVALGCPKQEKWLNMHYREAGVPVGIGVGATIDFLAGTMKRAPLWMQKTGLEWIFRLLQEPRRLFRRYVTDLWVFGWAILKQFRELRTRQWMQPAEHSVTNTGMPQPGTLLVRMPARLDAAAVEANFLTWQEWPGGPADVLFDFGPLEFIDSTGIGALIRLQKAMREGGKQLVLVAANPVLLRALALMKLSDFFAQAPDVQTALALMAERQRERCVTVGPTSADHALSIVWRGEITAANAAAVAEATESFLANASGRLAIDLAAVRFIDSTGIGLLVRFRKQAQRRNLQLEFVRASENVRNVVRLLRMEQYLFGNQG